MQFSHIVTFLERLEATASRLEMTAILAELFVEMQSLPAEEIQETCYLLQGRLLPQYTGVEFQVAGKTVIKALARLLPASADQTSSLFAETSFLAQEKEVEDLFQTIGDLGQVALMIKQKADASHQESTLRAVYAQLATIAHESGDQSQQRKLDGFVALLRQVDPPSAKFIVRIVLGKLRLGFSDMTMIDALSWAMTGTKDEHDLLEDAYQKQTDIGRLAAMYVCHTDVHERARAMAQVQVKVGIPVIPALCQRLNSAAEMIEKMQTVIAEPKYDGLRVQIHVDLSAPVGQQLHTFTRNLEETTHMFPELLTILNGLACQSCILDAEAIGYDPASGDLLPFQQTIQRKRKHDVAQKSAQVPVRFYVFDILAKDGVDMLSRPLSERKALLATVFTDNAVLIHPPELRTSDPDVLHHYHEQLLADGLEGVVVKQLDGTYQSGRKGWSWVKMKEAEGSTGKLADTIDVLVLGYYRGKGKRADFGIGAFLVGIFDAETEQIVTIAKIGTGLTDDILQKTKQQCDALAVSEKPALYVVPEVLSPDVWCKPGFVVEVAADEITISPLHSAKRALRFPRLVKFRSDKAWNQVTTVSELLTLSRSNELLHE